MTLMILSAAVLLYSVVVLIQTFAMRRLEQRLTPPRPARSGLTEPPPPPLLRRGRGFMYGTEDDEAYHRQLPVDAFYAPIVEQGAPLCMAVRDGQLCVRPHTTGTHVATEHGRVVQTWLDTADEPRETQR